MKWLQHEFGFNDKVFSFHLVGNANTNVFSLGEEKKISDFNEVTLRNNGMLQSNFPNR